MSACARTAVTPPPPPAPAPVAAIDTSELAKTLDEARAMRQRGELDLYERSLRALLSSTDPVTTHRAQVLLGLHLFDLKRWDDAIPVLHAAATADAAVSPFVHLRLVEAEAARGNLNEAISNAAQIIATAPNTSAATIARLRLPALYAQANDSVSTDAAFAQIAAVPIDELSEQDFADLASRLAESGRGDLATELRMRLLRDYTQGRLTEKIYEHLSSGTDSPLDKLSLDDATRIAQQLGRADRYDQALDMMERIRTRFPGAEMNDLYRSVRLRALFNSRRYTQLLEETNGVKLDSPALQLLRARAAWRADRPQDFLAGLNALEKQYPRTKEVAEANALRAKYYVTDDINYEKSLASLKKAIDGGVLGNDAENIWTLGWTYTLAGNYDEALKTYARYINEYPDGDYKTNSLFWTGKIYEKLGRIADRDAALRQVITEYPYSYYAYRSREILGLPTAAPREITGGAIFPDIEAQLQSVTDPRIDAVRELIAVDLLRDATREMKSVAAAYPDNAGVAFMLADVYVAGGEPFKANGILQRRFRQIIRHGGSNVPQRFWQILFPLNYWEAIAAEGKRRNIDPYLIASIIRQESGFEPSTVSNAGAVGLMQIMPNEAARIASLAGIEGMTRERLFNPEENIAVGAAEYDQKLTAMNGNHILAIASYNAGMDPVGRWLARTPIDDGDLFVESIPYAETRLYVKSVTRNRFEYRRIYENSSTGVQPQ